MNYARGPQAVDSRGRVFYPEQYAGKLYRIFGNSFSGLAHDYYVSPEAALADMRQHHGHFGPFLCVMAREPNAQEETYLVYLDQEDADANSDGASPWLASGRIVLVDRTNESEQAARVKMEHKRRWYWPE